MPIAFEQVVPENMTWSSSGQQNLGLFEKVIDSREKAAEV